MRDRGLRYWLPTYLAQTLDRRRLRAGRKRGLTHVLFLVCDHFEPRHGIKDAGQPTARLQAWNAGYKKLQEECYGRYGLRPVHTWFYPPHHGYENLPALARMAFDGLGEVELHYHHHGDSADSLTAALQETIVRFQRAGLLLQLGQPPTKRFGFIHGDWALDNSGGGRFCGVNGELSLLQGLGCWADLTMPSANECQTRKINSIYYATDSPARSKSHDWGHDARVGETGQSGLMLIQGPLAVGMRGWTRPQLENANLTTSNWGTPTRIHRWIDSHVHVRGRPEWLFVKLHTHGAIESDFDALFGERAKRMHAALAEQYNDGKHFRLHYVTARQAFNLARAAEAGHSGDPSEFLDWEVPAQATSRYCASASHDLSCCTADRLIVTGFDTRNESVVGLRYPGFAQITGPFSQLDVSARRAVIGLAKRPELVSFSVRLEPGVEIKSLRGAQIVAGGAESELTMEGNGEVHLELGERLGAVSCGVVA